MDPEQVAVDREAVRIARSEGLGRAIFYRQDRNAPNVYERPGKWPATRDISSLPSVAGVVSGPARTVHPQRHRPLRAQSHLGPSWNLPAILTLRDDVHYESMPGPGIISQILSQRPSPLMDRLIGRR